MCSNILGMADTINCRGPLPDDVRWTCYNDDICLVHECITRVLDHHDASMISITLTVRHDVPCLDKVYIHTHPTSS